MKLDAGLTFTESAGTGMPELDGLQGLRVGSRSSRSQTGRTRMRTIVWHFWEFALRNRQANGASDG